MMKNSKTLTFAEAYKTVAPTAFTAMVKPVGASCNLSCSYCYYLDKAALYPSSAPVMTDGVLEKYIRQMIEGNDVPAITFCWHGGEPLLAGVDFYRKALSLQQKYANGKRLINTFQTNGTLINREWCCFFKDNDILVGVSIDGPQHIHDTYRVNRAGNSVFSEVMRGIELMIASDVEFNTLSAVNKMSEGSGVEVYRFLKSIGSTYMQFLPVVEKISSVNGRIVAPDVKDKSEIASWSVGSLAFGKFMTDIFDEWVKADIGIYFVQLFDVALAQWYGVQPGLCVFSESCGDALAVEHNGDVYSCDHFVYPENKLGNLMETAIRELYTSSKQYSFGVAKRGHLPDKCLACRYRFACTGGCPKHRFMYSNNSDLYGISYLCEGYCHFFSYVEPYMQRMAELLRHEKSPALIMDYVESLSLKRE